jgi:hypothetical protein
MPAVREIVRGAGRDDYRFADVVTGIVTSEPFRFAVAPGAGDVPAEDRHAVDATASL